MTASTDPADPAYAYPATWGPVEVTALRVALDLTVAAFSDLVGYVRGSVVGWEAGSQTPSADAVRQLRSVVRGLTPDQVRRFCAARGVAPPAGRALFVETVHVRVLNPDDDPQPTTTPEEAT